MVRQGTRPVAAMPFDTHCHLRVLNGCGPTDIRSVAGSNRYTALRVLVFRF